MANIIPDEIKKIDEVNLPDQVKTIYEYIKYMREMIEFWSTNVNRGTGITGEAIKSLINQEAGESLEQLYSEININASEISTLVSEVWPDGNQRYQSRITQNARQIEAAVDAIWPDGTSAQSKFTQLANEISIAINEIWPNGTSSNSQFDIQADQISSKVETTDYTGAKIASLINQSASSVTIAAQHISLTGQNIADRINNAGSSVDISADHIDLNGVVTANNNFKILADGSMEAKNGNFAGEINCYDGFTIYTPSSIVSEGDVEVFEVSGTEEANTTVNLNATIIKAGTANISTGIKNLWNQRKPLNTPGVTASGTSNNQCFVQRFGNIVIANIYFEASAAFTSETKIISGLPAPYRVLANETDSLNVTMPRAVGVSTNLNICEVHIKNDGGAYARASAADNYWTRIVYITTAS